MRIPASLALLATSALAQTPPPLERPDAEPPQTQRLTVTDTYHGVSVRDPYRWLEDWSDPAVKEWSDLQNEYARAYLDDLPSRDEIEDRLTELLRAPVTHWDDLHATSAGDSTKLFALVTRPPKQQPYLAVLDSADAPDSERTIVDPETFKAPAELDDDTEGSYAIDWFVPSPDGSLVAVSMSKGGSESGDLFLFDTATATQTGAIIRGVNGGTAGGSLAWTPAGDAFYYTRYPREGERPADDLFFFVDVYRHTLGDSPAEDEYEIGRDFPKIGEIELKCDHDTGRVICTVQDGDGGEFAHFVRQPGTDGQQGNWTEIASYKQGVKQAYFGERDTIYLISRDNAPRGKILKVSAADPSLLNATTLIPEGDDTIVSNFWGPASLLATDGRLLIEYQTGGPSEIRVFDAEGNQLASPDLPPVSSIGQMTETSDGVLFSVGSFTQQSGWKKLDPATGVVTDTALQSEPPADLSGVTVVREFATSKDGTQVPINIMIPEGVTRDGTNPTVLYGYGGYGVNITPGYRAYRADLFEQGVVYAVANIRGGGEYGQEWHLQGNLTNKQNVFDDFQAAALHLINGGHWMGTGYTNPDKLAIMGGSNGGLLMGATLTQKPSLARTVVSYVGIYDMLRVELSPNGVFNIPEFGTVEDKSQFEALYAYSPYHNVEPETDYPAVLFLTGANDPRVDPMQSRKMTAMLQYASVGGALHRRSIPVDFLENALEDVLLFIEGVANTPLEIDWDSLQEAGAAPATPITWKSGKAPLHEILSAVLKIAGEEKIGWVYRGEKVVVAATENLPEPQVPAPNPVLLRTSSDTGHGGGTPLNEQIRQAVDVHAFLYHRLGVDYKPANE